MKMARTARVDGRLYGMKSIASLRIAINVTAVAKPAFIVHTILIRVPQIKQRMRYRLAGARQDATLECDQMPGRRGVYEISAFGRIRLEIGARDGRQCRSFLMLVSACGCEWS